MLTDGFIASSKPFELVKARRQDVEKAIAHLSTVQPGCDNPSWEKRPGGWFLHDYDDPIYANPLRETVRALQETRANSASAAGKASALARKQKYGTAQPPRVQSPNEAPNDRSEPPFENRSRTEVSPVERLPEHRSNPNPNLPAMRSNNTDVHGVEKVVSDKHGDVVTEVANGQPAAGGKVIVGRLLDWLCVKHDWASLSRDVFLREEAIAKQISSLGTPWPDLQQQLDTMWESTDPDDRPSTLGYFWTRLQDEAHAHLKQRQPSHARSESAPTKLDVPAALAGRVLRVVKEEGEV